MFTSLPHIFREHKLSADVRTLLLLRKAMDKGLVRTLGDIYYVLRGLITNSPTQFGPFATAFYQYFLDVTIRKGEPLEKAIMRSKAFEQWKENYINDEVEEVPDIKDLVDRFLDEVHLTSFDIQKVLSGKDILNKDDPDRPDGSTDDEADPPKNITEAVDYRDVPLEELLRRMKAIADQQTGKHAGGSHWIGTGGSSPYGNSGAAPGGIRAGGTGGGKMARKVVNSNQFYPIDTKSLLKDDNIDAALAALKGIEESTAELLLDIPKTIKEGLKQGGIFLPHEKEKIYNKVQVILLVDNGGWSMSPYVQTVTKLFSKMKTRFAHDLKTYYYHNTIYGGVYSDPQRRKFVNLRKLTAHDKHYSVFVIGDADMAPYELNADSYESWIYLKEYFKRMAWLNPMPENYWKGSMTAMALGQIFPMFGFTPEGIAQAVLEMNIKREYRGE